MKIILFILILIALLYIFPIGQIVGDSMHPTFKDGEIVLMCRIYKLKENNVYYFKRENKDVIKRLYSIQHSDEKWLYFLGDNSKDSFDSRHYGFINSKQVKAKILFKIGGKK